MDMHVLWPVVSKLLISGVRNFYSNIKAGVRFLLLALSLYFI